MIFALSCRASLAVFFSTDSPKLAMTLSGGNPTDADPVTTNGSNLFI